jgi:hypothetical protein
MNERKRTRKGKEGGRGEEEKKMECLLDWRIEEEYNLYQFLFSKQLE